MPEAEEELLRLLFQAVEKGKLPVVKKLIEAGVQPDRQLPVENGPMDVLHIAAVCGHQDILEYLLSETLVGQDVDNDEVPGGLTALHCACAYDHPAAAKILIRYKANLNARDDDKQTPLHAACKAGSKKCTRILLGAKAKVDVKDARGTTPLGIAVVKGEIEIVEQLIHAGANPRAKQAKGFKLMHCAVANMKQTEEMLELLAAEEMELSMDEPGGENEITPLMFAVEVGNNAALAWLIKAGASIDTKNSEGLTALEIAERTENEYAIELIKTCAGMKLAQNIGSKKSPGSSWIRAILKVLSWFLNIVIPVLGTWDLVAYFGYATEATDAFPPKNLEELSNRELADLIDRWKKMSAADLQKEGLDQDMIDALQMKGKMQDIGDMVNELKSDERFQGNIRNPKVRDALKELRAATEDNDSTVFEKFKDDAEIMYTFDRMRDVHKIISLSIERSKEFKSSKKAMETEMSVSLEDEDQVEVSGEGKKDA